MRKTHKQNKIIREKYYPKFKELIEERGEWNINCSSLSKKWDVPESTINRWKQSIVQEIGIIDIENLGRNIHQGMTSNLKLLQRINRKTQKLGLRLNIIKTYNDTVKSFTEFLEEYKYKEKVADKHELSGNAPVQFTINGIKNNYPKLQPGKPKTKKVHGKP